MQHATYTSVNHGNSRLVVIRSQIGSLTINLSFGHNLCFKYSNGSCEPILDIYVSKAFQWHNERFNPMNFNPWNLPLKIRESIETSTSKVGAHLRVCGFNPSHFPTLPWTWSVSFGFHSWPTTLQSLALVTSSRLWSRAQGYGCDIRSIMHRLLDLRLMLHALLILESIGGDWRTPVEYQIGGHLECF
jgi:hypothetical protein